MVWINGYQDWLSDADSLKNAQKVVDYLYTSGSDWTKESISALIGNMKHESSINPNMYEYGYGWEEDRGFGLVQWTPRSKFWDWGVGKGYSEAELRSGDSQLARLDYEVDNNIQYIANGHQWRYDMGDKYDFSFTDFRTNQPGLTVEQLTEAFMWNYEGPAYEAGTGSLSGRQAFALRAFNELNWNGGGDTDPPDPPPGTDIKIIEEMIATLYDFSNGQFGNSYIKGTKTMDNMYKLEVTQAFRDKLGSGGGGDIPDNKPFPPVSNYTNITAVYGYSDDYEGWHAGLDFGGIVAGVDGDPIYATMDGTIEIAEFNNGGLGNVVWLKHSDDAYFSAYAHLSGFNTTAGATVKKGDVIGYMGNTGYSFGTHLHFVVATVLWGNNESNTIDPKNYLGI